MKSSRYYARKADALRDFGYYAMADEMERMARRKVKREAVDALDLFGIK